MENSRSLYNLHTRLVRARQEQRGIRLTEAEFSMIVEETEMLDLLWMKVSDQLKGEGYAKGLTKSDGPPIENARQQKGETETPKQIFKRLVREARFDRISDDELPEEPFTLKLGDRTIRTREGMRAMIQEYKF